MANVEGVGSRYQIEVTRYRDLMSEGLPCALLSHQHIHKGNGWHVTQGGDQIDCNYSMHCVCSLVLGMQEQGVEYCQATK